MTSKAINAMKKTQQGGIIESYWEAGEANPVVWGDDI
jgi:hypothetical protein